LDATDLRESIDALSLLVEAMTEARRASGRPWRAGEGPA